MKERTMAEKKKSTPKKRTKKEEIMTPPLRKLTREEKMAYLTGGKSGKR
jgi:hypothetical protein